ncbi:MAG TPA: hypothetical protein VF818_12205 [Ktedonobacterales bacterium]
MPFTIKKGDLVYAADDTLGFVSEVYRPETGDAERGWAAVEVPGIDGVVYFTEDDVLTRDASVPSVLLKHTYADATDEAHRRKPEPIAHGDAKPEDIPLLEVGRPELPEDDTDIAQEPGFHA